MCPSGYSDFNQWADDALLGPKVRLAGRGRQARTSRRPIRRSYAQLPQTAVPDKDLDLHPFPVRLTQSKLAPVAENDRVIAAKQRVQLLDALQVDDRRSVNAREPRGVKRG